jgi:hypothetical protein
MAITVTPDALNTSARKYRKQLLIMAVLGLEDSMKHMSLRTGIRFEEVVGELSASAELEPYKGTIPVDSDAIIEGRTLKTYLGQCVKLFSPNDLVSSLFGSEITSGKAIENVEVVQAINAVIMSRISQGLNANIFSAVRKASGTTTADLFDGLDTIVEAEIVAAKISAAKRNYMTIDGAITSSNAVDALKSIYESSSDELQSTNTKLFIPKSVYNSYNEDYKTTTGAIPYNREFKKTFLEGSSDMCELVPLIAKKDSIYFNLTTKANTLIGTCLAGDYEKIEVRRGDNPFKLQFITTMFFGTQFESISPEVFFTAKNIIA